MVLIMFKNSVTFWSKSFVAVLFVLLGTSCRHEKPNVIYMPDMVYSPALKAQKEGSMLMPVKGTVARDSESYPYLDNPEAAGRELKNPLKPTAAILKRGQHIFDTYCMTCHGPKGGGDGSVVPKFPRPPSLQSDKVRGWPDGRIYHVITAGQNLMPSYASQISPGDRWAAIHYVRAIQRAEHPTTEDLKIADQESK
jgi:mono/diheme cytochrome c family protein